MRKNRCKNCSNLKSQNIPLCPNVISSPAMVRNQIEMTKFRIWMARKLIESQEKVETHSKKPSKTFQELKDKIAI